VVSHFHYVMEGGTVMAFVGGLFHWWPKMTGRMYSETWGRVSALIVVVSFNLTFFPQFVMGSQGMPRRYYHYLEQFSGYHQLSTVGAYLLGFGFLLVAITLVASLFTGARAPANPWGGATLEWACASPPPHHNFGKTPEYRAPYDFGPLREDADDGGYSWGPA
jgi:cytochrome c oxidase subunit 1